MVTIPTVLYSGQTYTTGGRSGAVRSHDGKLDVRLSPPGAPGEGTNPEQLLAAGWSSSLIGTLRHASQAHRIPFPSDAAIAAEVSLAHGALGFFLQARFEVSLPGMDPEIALMLIDAAKENCPYSKAMRSNISIAITLAGN